jgi:mannose-6-phosphate isomerase
VDRRGWGAERIAALRGPAGTSRLLPPAADEFFAADRLRGPVAQLDGAFSVVVVVSGAGTLTGEHDRLTVRRGDTLLVPFAAGPLTLTGDVQAVRLGAAR